MATDTSAEIPATTTADVPGMVNGTTTSQIPTTQFTVGSAEFKEKTDLHEISAKYPVLSGLAEAAAQKLFNDTMRADAATSVRVFIGYFDDVDEEEYRKSFRCFYDMDFAATTTGHYLSIIMTGSEYSGGAHPAAIYRTYVFDLAAGKFLALQDLFEPGSDYLNLLSSSALGKIAKLNIGDADWNRNGTAPQAENFRFFWLADDGLHILFPPYQVASYAEGEHEVVLPPGELDGFRPRP